MHFAFRDLTQHFEEQWYPYYVFETGHGSFGQDRTATKIAPVNETVFAAGADYYDARFGLQ
jgi:hypothetical protein